MFMLNEWGTGTDFGPGAVPDDDVDFANFGKFFATEQEPHKEDNGSITEFFGTAHSNYFYGDQGVDTMYGVGGNDALFGGGEDDFLFGGADDDGLYGGDGEDELFGGDGDDFSRGGEGDDKHYGGAGNDVFYSDEGADFFHGGSGFDTLDYSFSSGGVRVFLDLGRGADHDADGDTYQLGTIEKVVGSAHDDVLHGDGNYNELYGEGGQDRISGGDGLDVIVGGMNGAGPSGGDILEGEGGDDVFSFRSGESGGASGTSIDTITDFDSAMNGNDVLAFNVNDTSFALASWGAHAASVGLETGVMVTVLDKLQNGQTTTAYEVFLQGESVSDMGVDDFMFFG